MLAQNGDVDVFVNNAYTPLSSFGRSLLTRTLIAIASGLKGITHIKSLRVVVRRKI